ncbi:MAG: alpha/beta hydrolase [Nitratireductor sp.]|nr:alpha/beta hydrolase [Nitratireductor sp.]
MASDLAANIDRRKLITGAAALAASSLILPGISHAAVAKNVRYGANSLDIYPSGKDNSPVMIYVHGGAWLAGNKGRVGSQPAFYNKMGYTYVSVGYTLYPSASVDRQAREIGQAVAWVKANISKYGGDPNRVALSGHSAGCHLASLAALSGLATGIKALIANDTAAYDLAYLAEINNGRLPVLYARPFSDRSKWTNWSPYNYVGQSARFPVLVCWSGGTNRDRISKRFADKLQAAGYPVSRFNGGSYNHISIQNAMGRSGDRLSSAMTAFLRASV